MRRPGRQGGAADLRQEPGVAYVFISHDLAAMRHVADEAMVIYLGRIVEHAARDA
jgi:dipeptide transport system ATP-binding protein